MKKDNIFENLFEMAYEPYIVTKKASSSQKNTFPTIFAALNHVEEHSLIKINPGLYQERFNINKCDLKIQASEITENTILINREYPNIIVDLPDSTSKVILESLKIANVCESSSKGESNNQGDHDSLKKHTYKSFKTHSGMNTCLYIKRGTVQLDQCRLSLAAYHRKQFVVPCIVVEKEGCLILNRSQIKGGEGTIGILCKGGKVIIKQSMICDHGSIGILASGSASTSLTIKNSNFNKCNESIVLNGPFEAFVENTIISRSIQTGIVLCTGNYSKIYNNEIKKGKGNGIEVKNSVPSVLKNLVSGNAGWGAKLISTSGTICKATLKFNNISQNGNGGILVEGSINHSHILSNQLNYNNRFGIRIENRATPHIFMNKINKTLGDGVHVMNNSSVFLQKNTIDGSLKSNLVIEGPNNIKNFIFSNKILHARGEGIFLVHCERFTLKNNHIEKNYNGIVSMTGVENIETNVIRNNEKNGIMLIRDNNVTITGNEFISNKKAGLLIRDSSIGEIQENHFRDNRSELVIENDHPAFKDIEESNQFGEGDLRIPSNYYCQLI